MKKGDGVGRTRRCLCSNAADTAPTMVSEPTLSQRKDKMKNNKGKIPRSACPAKKDWGHSLYEVVLLRENVRLNALNGGLKTDGEGGKGEGAKPPETLCSPIEGILPHE